MKGFFFVTILMVIWLNYIVADDHFTIKKLEQDNLAHFQTEDLTAKNLVICQRAQANEDRAITDLVEAR